MKKFLALGLAMMMSVAALTGCGGGSEETAEGGDAAATSGAISVVSREDGSGTRGAFIELFGIEEKNDAGEKVDMTTEMAEITNSTAVMMTTVAGNPNAIGYISLGSLDDSVKALKIDGAEATAENIKNGTYKVARPFNIATKAERRRLHSIRHERQNRCCRFFFHHTRYGKTERSIHRSEPRCNNRSTAERLHNRYDFRSRRYM